jgi:hypothetical protein
MLRFKNQRNFQQTTSYMSIAVSSLVALLSFVNLAGAFSLWGSDPSHAIVFSDPKHIQSVLHYDWIRMYGDILMIVAYSLCAVGVLCLLFKRKSLCVTGWVFTFISSLVFVADGALTGYGDLVRKGFGPCALWLLFGLGFFMRPFTSSTFLGFAYFQGIIVGLVVMKAPALICAISVLGGLVLSLLPVYFRVSRAGGLALCLSLLTVGIAAYFIPCVELKEL